VKTISQKTTEAGIPSTRAPTASLSPISSSSSSSSGGEGMIATPSSAITYSPDQLLAEARSRQDYPLAYRINLWRVEHNKLSEELTQADNDFDFLKADVTKRSLLAIDTLEKFEKVSITTYPLIILYIHLFLRVFALVSVIKKMLIFISDEARRRSSIEGEASGRS
jgi:hypothetical protein